MTSCKKDPNMKKIYILPILCGLLFMAAVRSAPAQSAPSTGIFFKGIQADITSAILFNRVSIYGDIDIYKKGPGLNSYGFQAGADLTHVFGLVKVAEGFPLRNLYFSLRASSQKGNFPVSVYLSYVNSASLDKSNIDRAGNFIKFGFDVNKYFWDNKLGLKFKLDVPLFTISGKNNGFYVGLGFVIGYLEY